jgi:amino acid permease
VSEPVLRPAAVQADRQILVFLHKDRSLHRIDLGGVPGQPRLGFTYWQDGKAFKAYKVAGDLGKFLGFVNALVLALFAYMGCEIVGVTVGEAKVSLIHALRQREDLV